MIGLVDGNNFYVSCERVFDTSLEGKPVAVLSNNDGCVISRSKEFKALNIPMGTPFFELRPTVETFGLILKSSNYALYGDMSRRLMAILNEFSPEVEPYSIDEAFVDISLPAGSNYLDYACTMRKSILRWIGIPCGIGLANTKTLAKIANHIGKKTESGVFIMPDDASDVLDKLPVQEVWGIGRRLAEKLQRIGVRTALQLARKETKVLQDRFSVSVARTALELQGIPAVKDEDSDALSQSVSCSRSFGHPVTEFQDLDEALSFYLASSAEKLRSEKQIAAGVNVYFQLYPDYKPTPVEGGYTSTTIPFAEPTDDTSSMLHQIRPFLRGIFVEGRRYKKAGVIFFGLEPKLARQQDLFKVIREPSSRDALYEVVDRINQQHGRGTVFTLSTGIERKWSMKREMLTPRYTTDWNELPTVN